MQGSTFDRRVDAALKHLEVLWQRARSSVEPVELLGEALERLANAVQDLQVAAEELRQQNDELASAYETIEAERQRYQELFEFAPDGYLVTDAKGLIQDASLKAASLLQIPRQFLMGTPLLTFVDEVGQQAFTAVLSCLQKGEEVQEWELRLRPHNGGSFPASVGIGAVRDTAGRLTGLRWLLRNISERVQAEEAHAAVNRFLRTQAEVAQVALSSLQPEVLFPRLLETIAQAQGYGYGFLWRVPEDGREAVVVASFGQGTTAFLGARQDLTDAKTVTPLASAIRLRRPVFQNHVQNSPLCTRPIIRALRTQGLLALPLMHRSGRVAGVLSFGDSDDPERFNEQDLRQGAILAGQVAQAIENSELFGQVQRLQEQYRVMTESLTDAVYTVDGEQHITFGNPALERLTGYRMGELLSQPAAGLYALGAGAVRMMDQHRRNGSESIQPYIEATIVRRDGVRVPVEAAIADLVLEGRSVGRVGVLRNITERRRLEEQLRQLQKMDAIGRLAGGIAHDFNNLLQVIMGYSDLLLTGLSPRHRLRQHALEIKKASDQAAMMTRQLLTLSRKQVLQATVLDLNDIITRMVPMLQPLIGENITLITQLEPMLGRMKADPGQLEQVLLNLIINARDAMPQGGQITITTTNVALDAMYAHCHPGVSPGNCVRLVVRDTGSGMSEATRAHLFEPFFTTKEAGKGTGLGLATVYGIVLQSSGHIEVESTLGQGTAFTIDFPRLEAVAKEGKPQTIAVQPLRGTETILLVEDEPSVRSMVRQILALMATGCWRRAAVSRLRPCVRDIGGLSTCC